MRITDNKKELRQLIKEFQIVSKTFNPTAVNKLNKPASQSVIEKLKTYFLLKHLPEAIELWYSWQNGQKTYDDYIYIDKEGDGLFLMSIQKAIKTHKEIIKLKKEGLYEVSQIDWMPLFDNDNGGYIMYVLSSGKLMYCTPDYSKNENHIVSKSLSAWLTSTISSTQKDIKGDDIIKRDPINLPLNVSWKKLTTHPTNKEIENLPLNTIFYLCTNSWQTNKPFHCVWMKINKEYWVNAFSITSVKKALDELSHNAKQRKSAGYLKTNGDVWFKLKHEDLKPTKLSLTMPSNHKDVKAFGLFISN